MTGPVPVTFEPGGQTVWVDPGQTVLAAARRAGVMIPAPCGGRGICSGCGVRVVEGRLEEPDAGEIRGLGFAPPNVRLGCRARIAEAVTLRPVVALPSVTMSGGMTSFRSGRLVAAVDLGTTSVAAAVIDAGTGVEIGRAVVPNHQAAWGSDVLSRIQAAIDGQASDLKAAAEASILTALAGACDAAGSCVAAIERLVIAGNTAMSALLLGVDVTSLAAHPFEPPVESSRSLQQDSAIVGAIANDADTVVLPALGGFIGGDVTAGLVATGFAHSDTLRLFVDLGTNAEIVCVGPGELVGASAAAGPAFEGFGIRAGGPASLGAIERITLVEGRLHVSVIGGGSPLWLCGSGLVSAVALLRRLEHLDVDGKMTAEGPLEERFRTVDGVLAIDLVDVDSPAQRGGTGILLTQQDVRSFQLAKGAVLTAVNFVLDRIDVSAAIISEVAIAGAFGAALDPEDLVELGVLPQLLGRKLHVVGNSSLAGAAMIALDEGSGAVAESLVSRFTHVDLASDQAFGPAYLEALALKPQVTR